MIELTRGQELPLTTADGLPIPRLQLGVGWDKKRLAGAIGTGSPDVDLDASAIQFTGDQLFDLAFYNNLQTRDGSVLHQGDNLTGRGDGDDERLSVDLTKVYAKVDTIALLVSSYQGHSLEWIHNAYCRILDEQDSEIARFTLTAGTHETGLALALLVRDGAHWKLRAIGEGIAVKVPTQSVTALRRFL